MKSIIKNINKYPTAIPISLLVLLELGMADVINIGNMQIFFMFLIICTTVFIFWWGDYDNLWRAPLIGLLFWEVIRSLFLIQERHTFGFLTIILLVLTLLSIFLALYKKITIPKSVWGFYLVLICMISFFDLSKPLSGHPYVMNSQLIQWITVSVPFIILDLYLNKKHGWMSYLVYSSWVPISIKMYPVARIPYSAVKLQPLLSAGFWIISIVVFFVVIPLIFSMIENRLKRVKYLLSISAVTLFLVSFIRWEFLLDPFANYVWPEWKLIIKSSILLWSPFLIVKQIYSKDGQNIKPLRTS
jgi:hypothetical protein